MNEHHNIELDNSWIKDYDNDAADNDVSNMKLELFYKDNVKLINIIFVYIETKNDESHIIHVKKNKCDINKYVCDTEIFNLTVNNKSFQSKTYCVKTILKYNFTIEPDELFNNLNNNTVLIGDKYIDEHSPNFKVYFNDTIKILGNLNSLYFIMEQRKSNVRTRKIYLKTKFKNNKTRRRTENNSESGNLNHRNSVADYNNKIDLKK